jgi:hypothetical protein
MVFGVFQSVMAHIGGTDTHCIRGDDTFIDMANIFYMQVDTYCIRGCWLTS